MVNANRRQHAAATRQVVRRLGPRPGAPAPPGDYESRVGQGHLHLTDVWNAAALTSALLRDGALPIGSLVSTCAVHKEKSKARVPEVPVHQTRHAQTRGRAEVT